MFYSLLKQSRWPVLTAAIASIVAGLCSVLLVTQINTALTVPPAARLQMAGSFAVAVIGVLIFDLIAHVLFQRLRQRCVADLRERLAAVVMDAPYRQLEQLGTGRVQAALTDQVTDLSQAFVSVPNILMNSVIVSGCLIYLAALSTHIFVAGVVVVLLGSAGYYLAHSRAMRHLRNASKIQDRLFGYFRSLTDGAKELRQNRAKRAQFATRVLGQTVEDVRRERTLGLSLFEAAVGWGNFLVYAFIGLVLFVLAGDAPGQSRVLTGFALIFVYMVAPLQGLLNALPALNVARVASQRLDELTSQLASTEQPAAAALQPHFESLELRGLKHRYYHEQSNEFFELGPIDLRFAAGEIVFLVGGNGSGKTTLAKLLVGLYPADAGELRCNGALITDHNRDAYRQMFSGVFSDFHLFERLLDAAGPQLGRARLLLARLHLQHKVDIREDAFSTQALSQGQRKRLALIVAYLEERPFLVFDEWAADQDPQFKAVFYEELLPELRAAGKAVLVITHDDRYFDRADRLIRMENGQIISGADASAPDSAPRPVAIRCKNTG